jgi:hypothetical protein
VFAADLVICTNYEMHLYVVPVVRFRFVEITTYVEIFPMLCLNSKFPTPVELIWQNKNISKVGIVITKVGNMCNFKHDSKTKQRNLLYAKMKNALVKCFEEIKRLGPFFSFILKS